MSKNGFAWQYSDFVVQKVDPSTMQPVHFPTKNLTMLLDTLIDEAGATAGVEAFTPEDGCEWSYFFDEVQYVLSGSADIEYALAPLYDKWQKTHASAGSMYLIPKGSHVKFKVLGDEPFVHTWVVMPGGMMGDRDYSRGD
jgi:ethanolamine utilization protein EutQ (cupin superfamily)